MCVISWNSMYFKIASTVAQKSACNSRTATVACNMSRASLRAIQNTHAWYVHRWHVLTRWFFSFWWLTLCRINCHSPLLIVITHHRSDVLFRISFDKQFNLTNIWKALYIFNIKFHGEWNDKYFILTFSVEFT